MPKRTRETLIEDLREFAEKNDTLSKRIAELEVETLLLKAENERLKLKLEEQSIRWAKDGSEIDRLKDENALLKRALSMNVGTEQPPNSAITCSECNQSFWWGHDCRTVVISRANSPADSSGT